MNIKIDGAQSTRGTVINLGKQALTAQVDNCTGKGETEAVLKGECTCTEQCVMCMEGHGALPVSVTSSCISWHALQRYRHQP